MRDQSFLDVLLDQMQDNSEESDGYVNVSVEDLRAFGEEYKKKTAFVVGDIVTWKPGMKTARFPKKECPAVVMEIIPGRHDEKSGGAYDYEPSDIRVGIVFNSPDDTDGNMLCGFWLDSQRLELWSDHMARRPHTDSEVGSPHPTD